MKGNAVFPWSSIDRIVLVSQFWAVQRASPDKDTGARKLRSTPETIHPFFALHFTPSDVGNMEHRIILQQEPSVRPSSSIVVVVNVFGLLQLTLRGSLYCIIFLPTV